MFSDGSCEKIQDDMVLEKSITLQVDGKPDAAAVFTPGEEELWALGNLYCRRMIRGIEDIRSLAVAYDKVIVELNYKNYRCGSECNGSAGSKVFIPIDWQISLKSIMDGIDWIAEDPLFKQVGSVHVAAILSPDGEKLYRTEDIGRHNTVDKAVGWLLKNNMNPGGAALLTSGRLPEDMVMKGLGAGIPLMASISAPTLQGAAAAQAGNMTLVGFARNGRFNVYSIPERIKK